MIDFPSRNTHQRKKSRILSSNRRIRIRRMARFVFFCFLKITKNLFFFWKTWFFCFIGSYSKKMISKIIRFFFLNFSDLSGKKRIDVPTATNTRIAPLGSLRTATAAAAARRGRARARRFPPNAHAQPAEGRDYSGGNFLCVNLVLLFFKNNFYLSET